MSKEPRHETRGFAESAMSEEERLTAMERDIREKLQRSGAKFSFNKNHPSGWTFSIQNLRRQFFFDEIDHWFFPRLHELGITGEMTSRPDRGPMIDEARISFLPRKKNEN